jgi:mRNA interferase MazF
MVIYRKEYRKWQAVKQKLDISAENIYIRAGEIRWVAVGVNIGSEIDGKGASFTRPCLVLHVIGASLALVVPFTSQKKTNKQFYQSVKVARFASYLCLSQMRVVSQKRVFKRIAKMPRQQFIDIKSRVFEFYAKGDA